MRFWETCVALWFLGASRCAPTACTGVSRVVVAGRELLYNTHSDKRMSRDDSSMTQDTVNKYPLWQADWRGRVHELYAQARVEDPVFRAIGPVTGNPFWVLTRYDDCVKALKHPRIGKNLRANLTKAEADRYMGEAPAADNPFEVVNYHLLNMDPPDHTRLRALVHKAFTPRMVDNLRPRIQQIADELLDEMAAHDELDLLAHYAFPLPITVIAEMLGVPAADRDRFRDWSNAILFATDEETAMVRVMEFSMYMQEMIDARQAEPRDDLISALVQAEEDGDKLDRMELMSMIFLLLVAGHETTVNLIGNGMLALIEHPAEMARLQADIDNDDLLRSAVEEMLRYNGPVETTTFRAAFEDIDFGDAVVPRGEAILVALLAANRDPGVFPEPDRFDITRQPNRHIAFGSGIHYCVGAPLARLEGQIAIRSLVRRFPRLSLAVAADDLVWSDNLLLRGMKSIPVRLHG